MRFGRTYTSDGFHFVEFPGVVWPWSSSHDVFIIYMRDEEVEEMACIERMKELLVWLLERGNVAGEDATVAKPEFGHSFGVCLSPPMALAHLAKGHPVRF